ncbi:DDE-type integrase/transposase/recombinase [Caldicellulosiruptoraceae bacterium PP1]
MVNKYAKTAAALVKAFVDNYNYKPSNYLAADETYIKVKGIKYYVWFIMDALKKSILGYRVSSTRDVSPCILTMRMAFAKFKEYLVPILSNLIFHMLVNTTVHINMSIFITLI